MRFSVIMPTMDRVEILRATLEGLKSCDPPPDEVIVIDAADGSAREVVERVELPTQYHKSTPSLTHQRNLGIDDASGDVLVFLDDDVTVPGDLFARLREVYADPSVAGATGRIVEPEGARLVGPRSLLRRFLPGGGREGTFTRFGYPRYLRDVDTAKDVEFMLGCFMTARREAADRVRFDENLTGYALAEDEDFSLRLSRLGRIRYVPEIVVHHRKLGFTGKADERAYGRLVVRNRAYLFRKNFRRTPLASGQFALLVALLVLHRVANLEWRGAVGIVEGAAEALRERRA